MTPYLDSLKATYKECRVRLQRPQPRGTSKHWQAIITLRSHKQFISVKEIIARVAEFHELTVEDMRGVRRTRQMAVARAHAAHLIRELRPDQSLPAIGRAMGGKHHTSILHSIENIWPRHAKFLGNAITFGKAQP